MGFNIGEYVIYYEEYYNGRGGYGTSINYGCIVSANESGTYNVIKQYGGQIWFGVTPKSVIDEENFLEKFSIYDEFTDELVKIKNTLPEKLRVIIEEKIYSKKSRVIKSVFAYALKMHFVDKNFSLESWYIQWYVFNVLRSHEPWSIRQTLTFCHGSTKELQDFMNENVDFMIEMQFFSRDSNIIYFIEEKILEFKHKIGKISDSVYLNRVFPVRVKKLEIILKFKMPIEDMKIKFYFTRDGSNYQLEMPTKDLFDSKIVFPHRYNSNPSGRSKCTKTIKFNKNDEIFKTKFIKTTYPKNDTTYKINIDKKIATITDKDENIVYKNDIKYYCDNPVVSNNYVFFKNTKELVDLNNLNIVKISHNCEHSSIQFSAKQNAIFFMTTTSGCDSDKSKHTIDVFSTKTGNMLGFFEIHYHGFDNIYKFYFDIY